MRLLRYFRDVGSVVSVVARSSRMDLLSLSRPRRMLFDWTSGGD